LVYTRGVKKNETHMRKRKRKGAIGRGEDFPAKKSDRGLWGGKVRQKSVAAGKK